MSVSAINSNGFSIIGDIYTPGQAKLVKDDHMAVYDQVTISEAAKELAKQMVEAMKAAAAEKTAEQRYQDAQKFGHDYIDALENGLKDEASNEEKGVVGDVDFSFWGNKNKTTTYTTEQGTVIGISSMQLAAGSSEKVEVYTLQITRKDGLQLNLDMSEDIRVNDLEGGGLSIHYAQSGITRIFDENGNETVLQGESGDLKGTAGNDVLINRHSSTVDGGDGDDVIINVAEKSNLMGGSGNDKILNMGNARYANIDTGAGDDAVYSSGWQHGDMNLTQGNNKVYAETLSGKTELGDGETLIRAHSFLNSKVIVGNGNLTIQSGSSNGVNLHHSEDAAGKVDLSTGGVTDANIVLNGGGHNLNIASTLYSTIDLGGGGEQSSTVIANSAKPEGNSVNIGSTSSSKIYGGEGDNVINIGSTSSSKIYGGEGDDIINIGRHNHSTVDARGGNDTITVNHMWSSKIYGGAGNDIVYSKSTGSGAIYGGDGNDTIYTNKAYGSVEAGSGSNNVYRIPEEMWEQYLENPSAFSTGKQWVESHTNGYTNNYSFYDSLLYDMIDAKGGNNPWNKDK